MSADWAVIRAELDHLRDHLIENKLLSGERLVQVEYLIAREELAEAFDELIDGVIEQVLSEDLYDLVVGLKEKIVQAMGEKLDDA